MLSDMDIKVALSAGHIKIIGRAPDAIGPSSIDVCLDRRFLIFPPDPEPLDTRATDTTGIVVVRQPGEPFQLEPGQFVLGSTVEEVTLNNMFSAQVDGRSSLGRVGLLVHSTAGFIDPGFTGHITLELKNLSARPLLLWPGSRVAQLVFFRLSTPSVRPYGRCGRYQGQRGPTPSKGCAEGTTPRSSAA